MNQILCVSYPRSGSGYLFDAVQRLQHAPIPFCDYHRDKYDPETHVWVKHHDLALLLNPTEDFPKSRLIVLIRNPFDAIASFYTWQLGRGDRVAEDTMEAWREFYPWAAQYWCGFFEKWTQREDAFVIFHRDLARSFKPIVRHAYRILTGSCPADPFVTPPRPPVTHVSFHHYHQCDFDRIRELCGPHLKEFEAIKSQHDEPSWLDSLCKEA